MKLTGLRPIYVLIVLSLISLANYYDRNLISILVEPIKHDLHVSDTQIGLLTGLAFAVVYSFVGIPVARLADRFGRTRVLGAALTIWSAMTIVTGMSTSFATMLLARLGVGVGEAGGLPTTHALAAEYFSAKDRGKALSAIAFFAAGGISLALVGGGLIADRWGWRTAFILGGVAGLVIAVLLFLTVRDLAPASRQAATAAEPAKAQPSFAQAFAILWKRKAFVHLCLGLAWGAFGSYAQLIWSPAFLMRTYHLSPGQVGATFGSLTAVATLLPILIGGFFTDALARRDSRWPFWILAFAFALGLPGSLATFLTHDYRVVLALVLPMTGLMSLWVGPSYALVQNLSGAKLRATGAAVFMLMTNLIGLGLGPSATGMLSDFLTPWFGADSLRYTLCLTSLTFVPATIHFLLANRSVKADLAAAETD
jgi:MFS family permease